MKRRVSLVLVWCPFGKFERLARVLSRVGTSLRSATPSTFSAHLLMMRAGSSKKKLHSERAFHAADTDEDGKLRYLL